MNFSDYCFHLFWLNIYNCSVHFTFFTYYSKIVSFHYFLCKNFIFYVLVCFHLLRLIWIMISGFSVYGLRLHAKTLSLQVGCNFTKLWFFFTSQTVWKYVLSFHYSNLKDDISIHLIFINVERYLYYLIIKRRFSKYIYINS